MATPPSPDFGSLRGSANPIRVFVLNDNKVFVDALHRFLSDEPGIRVIGTAAGLPQALLAAEDSRPEVVVIDPEPHDRLIGQAIRELRATLPNAAIIVLTLHQEEPHREIAMAAGADAFIGKWAASQDLVNAIHDSVARRSRPGA